MMKGILPIVLIFSILFISIFPVNAVDKVKADTVTESNIETFFHEGSGT